MCDGDKMRDISGDDLGNLPDRELLELLDDTLALVERILHEVERRRADGHRLEDEWPQ
jgi:hypothetical protein